VDLREQLPFLHRVALDHRQLRDPSRDAARDRDDLAVDARVVEIDVMEALVDPVDPPGSEQEGRYRYRQELSAAGHRRAQLRRARVGGAGIVRCHAIAISQKSWGGSAPSTPR